MYTKGPVVATGAAAGLFAATNVSAVAIICGALTLLACAALSLRRYRLRRPH
jgi:hypothetical protein